MSTNKSCSGILFRTEEEWRHYVRKFAENYSPNWKKATDGEVFKQWGRPEMYPVVVSRFTDNGSYYGGEQGFLFVYIRSTITPVSIPQQAE